MNGPTPEDREEAQAQDITENRREERRKGFRREDDVTLEDQLEAVRDQFRKFFLKALVGFAVLGFTSAGGLGGFGYVLSKQSGTSKEIQKQRYDSLITSCKAQNKRHDKAITKAEGRSELPVVFQDTVRSIVDELQPYEPDCVAYAKSRVKAVTK